MPDPSRFVVVLGVTGSIAAYKAPEIVRRLRDLQDQQHPERTVDVRVILTKNGARFITPLTLQTVSGNPVGLGQFDTPEAWDVQHVSLADAADALLIAPASANVIAKLAAGIADDLLSSVALACRAPLLIAPAMNVHMWQAAATRANVRILQERGACFIGPDSGPLACGYEGKGRLSPVEEIVAAVMRIFCGGEVIGSPPDRDLTGRTVMITAGPTREYLDPVRYLTNPSSGKMGYALARAARRRGARVVLVSGPVSLAPPDGVELVSVTSAAEMAEAALRMAPEADVVIGAAAPADFTPQKPAPQKLKKAGHASLTVEMSATTDILAKIGACKRPGQVIVAFAAETEHLEEHAREKLSRKHADLVVANDVSAADAGFAVDTNRAVMLYADGRREVLPLQSKDALAEHILDAVGALLTGGQPAC